MVVCGDDDARRAAAAPALARDDDPVVGSPSRPRRRLRRRGDWASTSASTRHAARSDCSRLARLDDENAPARPARPPLPRRCSSGVPGVEPALARDARRRSPTTSSRSCSTKALDRDAVAPGARATQGVQTSLHYPPAHRFQIYADAAPDLPRHRRLRGARRHAAAVPAHDGGAGGDRRHGARGRRSRERAGRTRRPRGDPRRRQGNPPRAVHDDPAEAAPAGR